jgi:hypothetical protein
MHFNRTYARSLWPTALLLVGYATLSVIARVYG